MEQQSEQLYDEEFFKRQQDGSFRSAQEIVPLIMELIQPRSVVDVGCGVGTWLSVFAEWGVLDIDGIDGDYVDTAMLRIPTDRFLRRDLRQPLRLERHYDLVVSLEVAEHLPPESAETFVDSLVSLGPVLLFSAAIPYQIGVGHINMQWPSYWAELFAARDYAAVDCIRRRVWDNPHVRHWYAQNIILYVQRERLNDYPTLAAEAERTAACPLSLVHPQFYTACARLAEPHSKQYEELRAWADHQSQVIQAQNTHAADVEGQLTELRAWCEEQTEAIRWHAEQRAAFEREIAALRERIATLEQELGEE